MRIVTSSTRGDQKGNPDKQIEQANKLAKCVLAYKGTTRQERQNKLTKARGGFLPHPSLPPRARPEISPGRHGRDRLGGGSPPRLRQGQRPPRQALPQARPQGVHQGGGADGDRVRRHGLRRLLRQAHLHPHQQHHRRFRLDLESRRSAERVTSMGVVQYF